MDPPVFTHKTELKRVWHKNKTQTDKIFFQYSMTGDLHKHNSAAAEPDRDNLHSNRMMTDLNRLLQSAAISSEFN